METEVIGRKFDWSARVITRIVSNGVVICVRVMKLSGEFSVAAGETCDSGQPLHVEMGLVVDCVGFI